MIDRIGVMLARLRFLVVKVRVRWQTQDSRDWMYYTKGMQTWLARFIRHACNSRMIRTGHRRGML